MKIMKTKRHLLYSSLIISLLILSTTFAFGQGKNINKTYKWNYNVNSDVRLKFDNYDCDLVIHVWDKDEIEYHMELEVELRSERDKDFLSDFMDDFNHESSPARTEIGSRFWKNRVNIMGRKTMTLQDRKKIDYKKFAIRAELWIPRDCNLELLSKYSVINIDDINGHLSLNLYNDKVYADKLVSNCDITAKYSKIEFAEMKDIEADFYNTDLTAGNIGNMTISSRYSEIIAGDAGIINIESYDDDFKFDNTSDISYKAKYSNLIAGITGNLDTDTYEGKVNTQKSNDVSIKSKYTKYDIGEAQNVSIISSYEDDLISAGIKSLSITASKYGTYKIAEISNSLILDTGYSDKFFIDKISDNFKELKMNGKYLNLSLGIPSSMDCRLKANIKYPKLEYDESAFKTKIKIKEGSNLELESVKGTEKEEMTELILSGYEFKLLITEY